MATQVTLGSGVIDSASGLKLRTNGTTEAVDISTGQVATLAKDAVVNGLTVGRGAGAVSTNTAVGASALAANQAGGTNNTAIGNAALDANTTGDANTAVGDDALGANTTASNNTAVGYQAGYAQTTADGNALFGYQAGNALTTGNLNSFFGAAAGGAITTGTKNTIIGRYNGNQGGLDIRTANNHIVLSDGDGNPRAYSYSSSGGSIFVLQGESTTTYGLLVSRNSSATDAGYLAMGQANGPGSTGDHVWALNNNTGARMYVQNISAGVYLAQGGTSWTSNSDERLKTDLQPIENAAQKVSTLRAVTGRFITDDEGVSRAFLIAQDVQAVLPQAVDASDPEKLGVQYTDVIPLLVAAIKELKAEVDSLKAQINGASA